MKKMYYLCFVLFYLTAWMPDTSAASGSIKWYDNKTGMSLGKKEGKKILLHFNADWCGACKMMSRSTFKNAEVAAYLNSNFIPIMSNVDKQKKLADKYRVSAIPDTRFFTKDGTMIGAKKGYLPPGDFLIILKFLYTDSHKKMSLQEFANSLKK